MPHRVYDLDKDQGETFDKIVKDGPSFVRFHHPTCHFCKLMNGEWENLKTDKRLKPINVRIINVHVGALDNIKHPCSKHIKDNNMGVPSMFYLKDDTFNEFKGERKADDIVDFIDNEMTSKDMSGGSKKKKKKHAKSAKKRVKKSKTMKKRSKKAKSAKKRVKKSRTMKKRRKKAKSAKRKNNNNGFFNLFFSN